MPTPIPIGGAGERLAAIFSCDPNERPSSEPRLWRLTERQFDATVRSLAAPLANVSVLNPFDDAESVHRFTTYGEGQGVPGPLFDRAFSAAAALSQRWAELLVAEQPCWATPDAACVRTTIAAAGARAFRRPLSDTELDRYAKLVSDLVPTEGPPTALQAALHAMLASPYFLFRFERGEGPADGYGRRPLDGHEMASALSYTLTDGPPDEPLRQAAAQGTLNTADGVRVQVRRLLGKTQENAAVARFLREYLRYDQTLAVFKDPQVYPYHVPSSLAGQTGNWIADVVGSGKDLLPQLLTSGSGWITSSTAHSYNIDAATLTRGQQRGGSITYPAGQRSGILTQPSWLSSFSHSEANDPITRGKFIAQSLLCIDLPNEPPQQVPPLPDMPNATLRERLAVHRTSTGGCAACHDIMDGLGLGLESYDHTGRFRTMDGGKPVDARGEVRGTGTAIDGPFDGALELSLKLAGSQLVQRCFVRHAFQFWFGRAEAQRDHCTLNAAEQAFRSGNLAELLVALFASDSFRYRLASPGGSP